MRYRGLYKHANTLDSDPASWVRQNMEEEEQEEEEVKEEDGMEKHENKEVDPSYFQFIENEESKLMRKFLMKWQTYFNKSRQEVPASGKGKKTNKIRK